MTDLEFLFLILAAVYLTQCLAWVAPHAAVFSKNYRGVWRASAPELELNAWKIKAVLANPLPFFAGIVLAAPEPLAVSPELLLPNIQPEPAPGTTEPAVPEALRWSEIQKIHWRGDKVFADGKPVHRAISPAEARRTAALLRALAKLPSSSRASAIEKELKRQFDTRAIEGRVEEFHAATRWVASLANMLFVILLIIVPAYIWVGVLTIAWIALLTVTLLSIALLTRSFRRAHRALYPDEGEARWSETLGVALSPFAAMRACDTLMRPLLASFDPLAIAAVLLSPQAFEQVAARGYRNLRYPVASAPASAEPVEKETQWFRQTRNRILENFLRKNFEDVQVFLKPPAAGSKESRAYCPRCHNQFRIESGECSDCLGVTLQSLSP